MFSPSMNTFMGAATYWASPGPAQIPRNSVMNRMRMDQPHPPDRRGAIHRALANRGEVPDTH
jgi:hypothetical protein